MPFPNTHHTLIERLARGGDHLDWQAFLRDYWGPVCRFAMRRGGVSVHDAEEIASETFEVLLRKNLLLQWLGDRRAKLRTLLCSVTNRVQANYSRSTRRRELTVANAEWQPGEVNGGGGEEADLFYSAWVEDLLQGCVDRVVREYHRQERGEYARVLYGRICEGLTIAETAQALNLTPDTVNNYYRHAKQKLGDTLRSELQGHVMRYRGDRDEFDAEWGALAAFLAANGGLEDAVRRSFSKVYADELQDRRDSRITETLSRIGISQPKK